MKLIQTIKDETYKKVILFNIFKISFKINKNPDNDKETFFNQELQNAVKQTYALDNYLIEYNENAQNNDVVIYFSSNGIWYPDNIATLEKTIIKKKQI